MSCTVSVKLAKPVMLKIRRADLPNDRKARARPQEQIRSTTQISRRRKNNTAQCCSPFLGTSCYKEGPYKALSPYKAPEGIMKPLRPLYGPQAPFHLSNNLKRAIRKLSLPEGIWELVFICFPMVLHVFWGSLASPKGLTRPLRAL